ncbi:spore coat protein GerQ [Oceanobacillus indicireducens]|uniref:Spore coat protein GerQ n=1 Tax=Oceanobacillus indicireducens TaxID=1004261 RepID=A0A917XRG3_9BACI|nr:spore coat protein GerQ [Oceanobacillus indicireducens]GGN50387.1 spore coat protein GerQ [Oceanobacillus indicireducens]
MSEEKEINQNQEEQSFYNYPNQVYYPQQQQQTYGFYPMYPAVRQMTPPQQQTGNQGMLPLQQSYIENILRLNRGKMATVHMTFEGNNSRTFTGIIEAAGRDHIILSEEGTGRRVLLLMVYLDYVTFNEEINYDYPFAATGQQLANFPPR